MNRTFVSHLPLATAAINAACDKELLAAAYAGRNQVVKNLTGMRTGKRYRVPGKNTWYTASAPGESPAVRTGDLRGSYRAQMLKPGEAAVGSDKDYALPLEKKPPSEGGREHLRPSLEQARPKMLAELSKRWF